jgi:phage-related protein
VAKQTSDDAEWEYYAAPGGGEVVEKELAGAGLTKQEAGRLEELMERIRTRQTRKNDVQPVGKDVLEGRLSGDSRIFRLFYAELDGGLVFLALGFAAKKARRIQNEISKAQDRLADWKQRSN